MTAEELIRAAMESDEAFIKEFQRIIKEEFRLTAVDFSERAGIPASTIYKLLSGQREPNIKTLRQIVAALRKMERTEKHDFIAVIAARPVLDYITEKKLKVGGRLLTIREYFCYINGRSDHRRHKSRKRWRKSACMRTYCEHDG